MSYEQSAGRFKARMYAGGYPILADITDSRFNLEILNVNVQDMHDLRHVVERMIVNMEAAERK